MKRQTPHYEPNQIRLWLYIISADCWWGALIICSYISPGLVWMNRQLRLSTPWCHWPTSLLHWLLLMSCYIYLFLCFLKEEQAANATLVIFIFTAKWRLRYDHVWLIILKHPGNIWILVLCTWEPWLLVWYNQLSIYSLFHHWAVTGDTVIIYCCWQLTAEHEVRQFGSLCVVFGCIVVGFGSHCIAFVMVFK